MVTTLGTDAAVEKVARVLRRQYESEFDASHLSWHHFADDAREILAALELVEERAFRQTKRRLVSKWEDVP